MKGLLDKKDPNGMTLREALEEAGMDTSEAGFHATSLHPTEVGTFIFFHFCDVHR